MTTIPDDPEYRAALETVAEHMTGCPRLDLEYGVLRDMRRVGLGFRLDGTTRNLAQATEMARRLRARDWNVEVKQRLVITLPWQTITEEQ